MPQRTYSGRASFLVGTALLLYLYWILDFLAIQSSWLCLLALPALVPVRTVCLAAMAILVTASSLGFVMVTGVRPSFDAVAVGVTCSTIPAVMLVESVRGTLLSPWAATAGPRWRWLAAALRRICIGTALLLLVPLISRRYPAEIGVPFAAALLLTARALPAPAGVPRSDRGRLTNGLLAAAGALSGLVILEAGARRLEPPAVPQVGMLQPDPATIFRLRPSKSAFLHYPTDDGALGQVRADISAQGLRDRMHGPKAPDEFRILLLGDSFTYGQTVEFADTIGQQLEMLLRRDPRRTNVAVINLGVPATGPWQQKIFLEDVGFTLEPDFVIHQLFLGNDLHDTLTRDGRYLRLFATEWAAEIQRLRMLGTRRFRAEQRLADHSRAYLMLRESVGRDWVTRFLARGCRLLPPLAMEPIPETKLIPPTWEVNRDEWYPEIPETLDEIAATADAIRTACASRGIEYAVYAIPIAEEVVPEWYDEARKKHKISELDQFVMGKGLRYLDERLAARGLPVIPVPGCLQSNPAPERLYLKVDGHTTPAGNEAIAQCLYDYLSSRTAVP